MASAAGGLNSLETLSQHTHVERFRSETNGEIVRRHAKQFLGHIYNLQSRLLEGSAVQEDFPNEWIRLDSSGTSYEARLYHTQEVALEALNNLASLDLKVTAIPVSLGASAGSTTTESTESNCIFCVVTHLKVDRCSLGVLHRLPSESLPQGPTSLDKRIVKSGTVYVGYRIVLELFFHQEKTAKKRGASAEVKVPALSFLSGKGEIDLQYGNVNLFEKEITQVNIKEIATFGDYRVPEIGFVNPNDLEGLQRKLEAIRSDFLGSYFSLTARQWDINPDKDLASLREPLPSQSEILGIQRNEEAQITNLQRVSVPRKDYFSQLAQEINAGLSQEDRASLEQAMFLSGNHRQLNLDLMLYGMEKAFRELFKYMPDPTSPNPHYHLILGDIGVGKSIVGASLMGATLVRQLRLLPGQNTKDAKVVLTYRASQDFPEIKHDGDTPDGVKVYGRFVEMPLLTNSLGPEEDLCYGVATRLAIMHYSPEYILVVLKPEDLKDHNIQIISKLRRVVYDPLKESRILFVINHKEQGPWGNNKEIVGQIEQRQRFLGTTSGLILSWINSFFRYSPPSENERVSFERHSSFQKENEILEFIRNHMADAEDLEAIRRGSLPSTVEERRTRQGRIGDLPERIREGDSLKPHPDFDLKNLVLNSSPQFNAALNAVLRHLEHLEKKNNNAVQEITLYNELVRSIDKICELLQRDELHGVDRAEAERLRVETIGEEIRNSSELLQRNREALAKNRSIIESLDAKIKSLEENTALTELEIFPSERIEPRSRWRIYPFAKEYRFDAQNYTIHECLFIGGKGVFSCDEQTFKTEKKVRFTPGYWGYPEDLDVRVLVWIEKKDHPTTHARISQKRAIKKNLEEANTRLAREISATERTIEAIRSYEILRLQYGKTKAMEDKEETTKELASLQAQFNKHKDFYAMLKFIRSHIPYE